MINVDENIKNLYRGTSADKKINIKVTYGVFRETVYIPYDPVLHPNDSVGSIVMESMKLKESFSESDSIEFIGCIASQFNVKVHGVDIDLKNAEIEVTITSGGVAIPLFHGIVDEAKMEANRNYKNIVAYDLLYTKGKTDVAQWYVNLNFPMTLKTFRDKLFNECLQIEQVQTTLPCDNVEITKQYSPTQLKALHVIKSICQINAVFGIINRDNKFAYKTLPKNVTEVPTIAEHFDTYKTIDYQDYVVKPVDKLIIRQTQDDEGVTVGSGNNTYIIQNNMFTLNLGTVAIQSIAEAIFPNIQGFQYYPMKTDNNGLPWIECGDVVEYPMYDYRNSTEENPVYFNRSYYILSRTMSGIVNLRDNYEASGDELQREFITDLQSIVETLQTQVEAMQGALQDFALQYILFSNADELVIEDGHEETVVSVRFAVRSPVQVLIEMEYLIEVETAESSDSTFDIYDDCEVKVKYYYDGVWLDTRQPEEVYMDGKHILKMIYVLNVQTTTRHTWAVRLQSNHGNVKIRMFEAFNAMVAQGIIGETFDGNINAEDSVPVFNFRNILNTFTDNAVVTTQTPIPGDAADNFRQFGFRHLINTFTDSVSCDSDFVRAYYGDGLSSYTCQTTGGYWHDSGEVITTEVNNTTTVEVGQKGNIVYQCSFNGGAWKAYINNEWVENETMSKSQLEAVTTWESSAMKIKAILADGSSLGSIQFNGGSLNA